MLGRSTLFVPEGMMERIDAHRGELSRLEFLEFCIGTTVSEELRREERRGAYRLRRPQREEYQEEPAAPRRVAEEVLREEPTVPMRVAEEAVTREEFEGLKQSIRELAALREAKEESATREEFEGLKQSIRELVMLRGAAEESVTKEEFEEFRQNIKELQKSFIDFFVTYGLEFGGKIPEEEQERFKENAKRLLGL